MVGYSRLWRLQRLLTRPQFLIFVIFSTFGTRDGSAQCCAVIRPLEIDIACTFEVLEAFVGHGEPRSEVTEASEVFLRFASALLHREVITVLVCAVLRSNETTCNQFSM